MSADDQAFLDVLSSVPNDIKKYSSDVADYVDKHLNHVSNVLRDTLSSSPWIPESARPRPPSPPPRAFPSRVSSPASLYERVQHWVSNNKLLTTAIVVAVGGATYYVVTKRTNRKKRRARRSGSGARVEVVVIAGSPSDPITRSVALDLERRGFIVYVVCNTIEEEMQVRGEARPDIKPLSIDIVDPSSARASIDRFTEFLFRPHTAFAGSKTHHLILRSVIFIPGTTYPSQPIATLPPGTLSDLLNTRLLTPIITLQNFLPLLQDHPLPQPQLLPPGARPPVFKPSVLLLTPSIIPSIQPAFHLPESMIVSALSSFSTVLASELAPLDIPVTHLQLGTFDLRAFAPHNNKQLQTLSSARAESLKWDESARLSYAKNFNHANRIKSAIGQGTSLRVLNDAVFDAMVSTRGGVVRVGVGSSVYGLIGRWAPSGLVGWMMGVKHVNVGAQKAEFGRGGWFGKSPGEVTTTVTTTSNSSGSKPGSRGSSGSSSSSSGSTGSSDEKMEHSEYINVYDHPESENIWREEGKREG
ncbi:hypothetical protein HYALB_00011927 [Hymenoscyphus albidus]|uniref:DUF1776-domain-containing protein n=1 Tax=Hymenoscyphus albidus TaxID=595503 RepID=A0A9N9PXS2_9HELO|nr:hypothetical protein HYALB_00011927 [Hymenoscyphus albidus]